MARWCDGGRTQCSRLGTLTDKAVKTAKRWAAAATLGKVQIEKSVLGNVYSFEYLGSRLQCERDDEADVHCTSGIRIIVPPIDGSSPIPQHEAHAL